MAENAVPSPVPPQPAGPQVGTPVQYRLGPNDVLRIMQARTSVHGGNTVNSGDTCAALVVRNWGTSANLKVLIDGNDADLWVTSMSEGEGPYTWSYLPGEIT